MPRVYFLNDDVRIEVAAGQSLSLAASEADASLVFGCRAGTCGTCVVTVVEGGDSLEEASFVETDTLAVCGESGPGRRLGCQILVRGEDLSVEW